MPKNKNKFISEFIELYKNLPEVWDINNSSYNNRNIKNTAYFKLINKLRENEKDATRETVVKKINSLRTNYRKEIKKINSSSDYTPSLWYFDQLKFLQDQEKSGKNIRTKLEVVDKKKTDKTKKKQQLTVQEEIPKINVKDERKSMLLEESSTSDIRDIITKTCENFVTEKDEFQIMAFSYAQKLKKMDFKQCLYADKLIHEVLMEGQLGNLMKNSSILLEGIKHE